MATISITLGTQTVTKDITDGALTRIIAANRDSYTLPAEAAANNPPNDNTVLRRAGRALLNAILDSGNNHARTVAAAAAAAAVQNETGTDV